MVTQLWLSDHQAQALEEALNVRLQEMDAELVRTDQRQLQRDLHAEENRLREVLDQLTQRRRFLSAVLHHH